MCVISSPLTALPEGTVNLHRLLKAPQLVAAGAEVCAPEAVS